MTYGCILCGRIIPLTFHHLIPKETHLKSFNKDKTPEEMNSRGIWVCRPCHSGIHNIYDNDTLAISYNTLDLLLKSDRIVGMAKY